MQLYEKGSSALEAIKKTAKEKSSNLFEANSNGRDEKKELLIYLPIKYQNLSIG
ncbi:hypothetical protein ACF5W4_03835 [Bacillota bacterium Lsc_1132]